MSDDDTHSEATLVRRPGEATMSGRVEVQHALLVPQPDAPPLRVPLGPIAVVIGRVPPADIVIGLAEISRRHAEIFLAEGRAMVRDLGSTNGTWVDGVRITDATPLQPGGSLRVGHVVIEYEARGTRAVAEEAAMEADLARASAYVAAILPQPLREGALLAEHFYLPSARLGGDAFGYQELSPGIFAGYILDVTGHGVGAAMHAVSLANVLRQPGLLGADLAKPADVVARLNQAFPMERTGGLLFSIWYWAYDATQRVLEYCSGGHHPALLLAPGATAIVALDRNNPVVGAMEDIPYTAARLKIRAGCRLYLFSDGAFEVQTESGVAWGQPDIAALVRAAPPGGAIAEEPGRLYAAVRQAARHGPLDDDFSVLVLGFE